MRDVLRPILEPVDSARRLFASKGEQFWSQFDLWYDLDENNPSQYRAEALRRLKLLPSDEAIDIFARAFSEAIEKKPTTTQLMLLIGLMLDSFPTLRVGDLDTYTDALTFVAEDDPDGFSLYVVARAVVAVIRTLKWPPSPSEFLEIATQQKKGLRRDFNRLQRVSSSQESAFWVAVYNGDRPSPFPPVSSDDECPF